MLQAWEVVLGSYPGWCAEIWGRHVDGGVELVVRDRVDFGGERSWMAFLVRGIHLADEYLTKDSDWASYGFQQVHPAVTPLDRLTMLRVYTHAAREAQTPALRVAAAAQARALVPILRADLASAALDFGFPDHAAAASSLSDAEAELRAAEAALRPAE